ncbi:hypothetical protein C8Q76DRAFT_797317 [Earliella scabrosa]|nr:hypothetical protein C8Q76DRAFT_797317 [Earliella scabrosa]
MSTARRHDLVGHANVTDEEQTYKKPFQTAGRPAVTGHDMQEDYMRDPPNNQPFELTSDRHTRGAKEGAQEETDPKQDGVLGNQDTGKQLKQNVLEEFTTESSVHSGNPSS